ncbi:MAG: hypothetical protein SFT91_05180 [Rickettsiaceae bacterium]|nr:hypothetical protein [Rickettsiaceae bacterium]
MRRNNLPIRDLIALGGFLSISTVCLTFGTIEENDIAFDAGVFSAICFIAYSYEIYSELLGDV